MLTGGSVDTGILQRGVGRGEGERDAAADLPEALAPGKVLPSRYFSSAAFRTKRDEASNCDTASMALRCPVIACQKSWLAGPAGAAVPIPVITTLDTVESPKTALRTSAAQLPPNAKELLKHRPRTDFRAHNWEHNQGRNPDPFPGN
jgi:hypothetical protein